MSPSADTPTSQPRPDDERPDARPFQFSLRKLMIWVAVFSLVCGLLASLRIAVEHAREAARFATCQCPLGQIHVALSNYHNVYGCYPPAYVCDKKGKPMHSWRVLLLPFLEGQAVYSQYDFSEPWDGPNNGRLAASLPPWIRSLYQCPSAGLEGTPLTSYVAVVGPSTLWPGEECTKCTGNTGPGLDKIAVVEIANSDIHWMEPRDLTIEQATAGIEPKSGLGISSHHPKGVNYISPNWPPRTLERDIDTDSLLKLLILDKDDPAIVRVK